VVKGDAAVAARLRVRERAQRQQQALAAVLAADDDVTRAEHRRAELTSRGDRIVADACIRRAAALRTLVEVSGSLPVAADLLGVAIQLLRRRLRDGDHTPPRGDNSANGARRSDT
jgi:hypothetical protein